MLVNPEYGFHTFLVATFSSLILSHLILFFHRVAAKSSATALADFHQNQRASSSSSSSAASAHAPGKLWDPRTDRASGSGGNQSGPVDVETVEVALRARVFRFVDARTGAAACDCVLLSLLSFAFRLSKLADFACIFHMGFGSINSFTHVVHYCIALLSLALLFITDPTDSALDPCTYTLEHFYLRTIILDRPSNQAVSPTFA